MPAKSKTVTLVDVQAVTMADPLQAVKSYAMPDSMSVARCDVLVVGGGAGGVAAALQACRAGHKVILTEETDWLGGQMTSQGVSALDENYLVETCGASLSYQNLRRAIRRHYEALLPSEHSASRAQPLNPGNCWVSALAFEPRVAVDCINELLEPAVRAGRLTVHLRTKAAAASTSRGKIHALYTVNLDDGTWLEIRPRLCLDATELGDLLPLCGTAYRCGSEARSQTGEPHAPEVGNPDNLQDFVYPFVVEFRPGEFHVIEKPRRYEEFKAAGKFSFQGYKMFATSALVDTTGVAKTLLPFWEYRRLIHKDTFPGAFEHDLAMINWDSNDLRGMNIVDKPPDVVAERLSIAKALSLGFLYWLQTEAPRDDGGYGYPELKLRFDVLGTTDGLSKFPYVREARRIEAKVTIVEQDIAAATTCGARARSFMDSVGIGYYPIDVHGEQEVPGAAQLTRPFQIPLGALIPEAPGNFIPACKNIGTTHITNGAYRLHPIEWATGEAAGFLAVLSLRQRVTPEKVWSKRRSLRLLQHMLVSEGVPVFWYDDVPTKHDHFAAIQFLAVTGVLSGSCEHLRFEPDRPVLRQEAAAALARLLNLSIRSGKRPEVSAVPYNRSDRSEDRYESRSASRFPAPDVPDNHPQAEAIAACLSWRLLKARDDGLFHPVEPLARPEFRELGKHRLIRARLTAATSAEATTRAELAALLHLVATRKNRIGRI